MTSRRRWENRPRDPTCCVLRVSPVRPSLCLRSMLVSSLSMRENVFRWAEEVSGRDVPRSSFLWYQSFVASGTVLLAEITVNRRSTLAPSGLAYQAPTSQALLFPVRTYLYAFYSLLTAILLDPIITLKLISIPKLCFRSDHIHSNGTRRGRARFVKLSGPLRVIPTPCYECHIDHDSSLYLVNQLFPELEGFTLCGSFGESISLLQGSTSRGGEYRWGRLYCAAPGEGEITWRGHTT